MGAQAGSQTVAALAARQHGRVTYRQLAALGVSRRVVERLVTQGWLHRLHRGVYAVGHPASSRLGRWMAATLATDGVLSHRAAGELWGILPAGQPIEVTLLRVSGRVDPDGVHVHRGRLTVGESTEREGVPVTTLVRTVLDLAAVLPVPELGRAFEEVHVRHGLRPVDVAAAAAVRHGHRGVGRLRTILAAAVEPGQVESVLELRFLTMCAAQGLPRPLTQVRFGAWRADFWFPDARVVVETDGARFHATAAKRAQDGAKDAALTALGITVVRVRWSDVTQRPAMLAARLHAAGVSAE